MGLIKIFSGTDKIATQLQEQIEAIEIEVVKKENLQSARFMDNKNANLAVELFIQEKNFHKANPIIEEFRLNL